MEYTREPIIQSVIAAREGHKLNVSNQVGSQLYVVDSLQVVLFGDTPFYRNIEGVQEFMCPAAHYSIEEIKESKIALKMSKERKIKISSKESEENKPQRPRKNTKVKPQKNQMSEKEPESIALFQPPSFLISDSIQAMTKNNVASEAKVEEASIPSEELPSSFANLLPKSGEANAKDVVLENLDE